MKRQALFIDEGVTAPENCLCVDGVIPGAAACYSHWLDASDDCPQELRHDLSTGMVLRAAESPEKYLDSYAVVANNHIDADGLLSMAVACDPSLIEYRELFLSAAAYGDFTHFTSEAGARFALCLHQYIVRAMEEGGAWQQACVDMVVPQMRKIIQESILPNPDRDQQVERILKCKRSLNLGIIALEHHENLSLVSTMYKSGHFMEGPTTVNQEDDIPPWALWDMVPHDAYQLLCLNNVNGTAFQLDGPRHAWAKTWDLPQLEYADFSAVRDQLQAMEKNDVTWLSRPQTADIGFVCGLASANMSGNALAQSSLDVALVRQAILDVVAN
ncbi:MAG: hypothetical protein HRU15_07350 [Planctomycetes bacterium]|nr:hypothetical protein [Planctomycetota bacterium]